MLNTIKFLKPEKSLVYFLLIVFSIAACNKKPASNKLSPELINNPATASGEKKGGLPVFEWTETRFDFGDVKEGTEVTHAFTFKNVGDADLIITSVSPSCGCTVPTWSKAPVKPGEEGRIDVKFNTAGKAGMTSKTIAVLANTVPSTRVLTISAEIVPQ